MKLIQYQYTLIVLVALVNKCLSVDSNTFNPLSTSTTDDGFNDVSSTSSSSQTDELINSETSTSSIPEQDSTSSSSTLSTSTTSTSSSSSSSTSTSSLPTSSSSSETSLDLTSDLQSSSFSSSSEETISSSTTSSIYSSSSSSSFIESSSVSTAFISSVSPGSSSSIVSSTPASLSPSIHSSIRSSSTPSSSLSSSISSSSSWSVVSTTTAMDAALGRLATFVAIYRDWSGEQTYYSGLDSSLYQTMGSLVTHYETLMFPDTKLQSSIVDAFVTCYDELPNSKQDVLEPSITEAYSSLLKNGNYANLLGYGSTITTGDSVSTSYDTQVTGTTGVYSEYYILAECDALNDDIASNGNQYNNFYGSYSSTAQLTSFYNEYSSYVSETEASVYNEMCVTLAPYVTMFPWDGRILELAKSIYYSKYVSGNPGLIYMGDQTLTQPTISQSYNTEPFACTGTGTYTNYYPFVVQYSLSTGSSSDQLAQMSATTVVSVEETVFTTGNIKNVVVPTATVTSNLKAMITCGVQALVYEYYLNTKSYDSFIDEQKTQSYVNNYVNVLHNFSDVDMIKDTDAFQKVMVNFYNFIFELPSDKKADLADVMGYCYLKQETEGFSKVTLTDYKSGDGAMFSSLFKFGSNNQILSFASATQSTTISSGSDLSVTAAGGVTEVLMPENTYWPIFPTSVDGVGDSVGSGEVVDLRSGNKGSGGFFGALLGES